MNEHKYCLPRGEGAFNVMLSAAGRRVELMRLLERSLGELGVNGGVLATDITTMSPAMQLGRESVVVPPYRDPGCLRFLLDLCRDWRIGLIVPTIDPELGFYARHVDEFAAVGTRINISSLECVEIAGDKQRTHDWLVNNGLPTVRQLPLAEAIEADWDYPVMVKPRHGSASIGITRAGNRDHLLARGEEKDLIVQAIAPGREFTVDVFVDGEARCRCAVPRRRIETRGGEVSKGVTERATAVAELAKRVAEALPGARGVLNIQMFYEAASGELNVIEINPRFGGGYPLSHAAGATMTNWVLESALGGAVGARDEWREGVMMLRYDSAVFATDLE